MKKLCLVSILALALMVAFATLSRARQSRPMVSRASSSTPAFALHLNGHKDAVQALLTDSGEE